jgi:hypothetical protein
MISVEGGRIQAWDGRITARKGMISAKTGLKHKDHKGFTQKDTKK